MLDRHELVSRRIVRQMDHLMMVLKQDFGDKRPSFLLSLYFVGYDAVGGSGHVAWLMASSAPDEQAREAILTDNPGLLAAVGRRLQPRQFPLADPDRTALAATFRRPPANDRTIEYRVEAADLVIEARWSDLTEPIYAMGPTGPRDGRIASMLLESRAPRATINGREARGAPFPNPAWTPWFGEERGSCVVGLGETIWQVEEAAS